MVGGGGVALARITCSSVCPFLPHLSCFDNSVNHPFISFPPLLHLLLFVLRVVLCFVASSSRRPFLSCSTYVRIQCLRDTPVSWPEETRSGRSRQSRPGGSQGPCVDPVPHTHRSLQVCELFQTVWFPRIENCIPVRIPPFPRPLPEQVRRFGKELVRLQCTFAVIFSSSPTELCRRLLNVFLTVPLLICSPHGLIPRCLIFLGEERAMSLSLEWRP